MTRRVPKWLLAANLIAGIVLIGGFFAVRSLLNAIDSGKLKRYLADTRSLVQALEEYRADHGAYPSGFGREVYRRAVEPDYIRKSPSDTISYYSDGLNYALIVRPFTPECTLGATPRNWTSPIEIFNGHFVTWPDLISKDSIDSTEELFVQMHNTEVTQARKLGDEQPK